jgi:hypothetical protein
MHLPTKFPVDQRSSRGAKVEKIHILRHFEFIDFSENSKSTSCGSLWMKFGALIE